MATYEFDCETCKVRYEKEAPMSKPAKRFKCPKCKKMCLKVLYATPVHFKGIGWHQVRKQGREQFRNKEIINKFYNEAMEASKKRMKTGRECYSDMVPNYDYLVEKKVLKRKNKLEADKQFRDLQDIGRKLQEKHLPKPKVK